MSKVSSYLGFFKMLLLVVSLVAYAQSASMHGRGPEMHDQRHQQRRSAPPSAYYTEAPKYYTEAPKYYTEAPQYYTTPASAYVSKFSSIPVVEKQ
jgi:hypothetical protein